MRFISLSEVQKAATNELDVFIITLSSSTNSLVSHRPVSLYITPLHIRASAHTHTHIHTVTPPTLLTALFAGKISSTLKSPTFLLVLHLSAVEGPIYNL